MKKADFLYPIMFILCLVSVVFTIFSAIEKWDALSYTWIPLCLSTLIVSTYAATKLVQEMCGDKTPILNLSATKKAEQIIDTLNQKMESNKYVSDDCIDVDEAIQSLSKLGPFLNKNTVLEELKNLRESLSQKI